jgi:hypothetical protein
MDISSTVLTGICYIVADKSIAYALTTKKMAYAFKILHINLYKNCISKCIYILIYLIDQILAQSGGDWAIIVQNQNPFIAEQKDYDSQEQAELARQHKDTLNPDQHSAFLKITEAITQSTGEIFFLHSPEGTGKTYLYNTLCYNLHSQDKIIFSVASSGIAVLLKGGYTAHSCFKIPFSCYKASFCSIFRNTPMAALICYADLVLGLPNPACNSHALVIRIRCILALQIRDI